MNPAVRLLRRKALTVHRRLLKFYGAPHVLGHRGDGLSELIACILSQHTSDLNSERAFDNLRARFPTWAAVRDAPTRHVIDAIRSAGLANQKGPRIQGVLREITRERGELDINFLAGLPVVEAKAWLQQLHGVGPKTAAIVLLFALDRPAFPVDTHVHRVSGRLGLIPPKATADAAHDLIEALIPPGLYFPFHVSLIRHGREICHARAPRCEVCPLKDICDYFHALSVPATAKPQSAGSSTARTRRPARPGAR